MRLYITGIAGLLGANIALDLADRYDIYGCDLIRVPDLEFQYETFDLLDFRKIESSIIDYRPDVVIHTAAMVNVDECERNPERARILNAQLTKKISDICEKHSAFLVYISTDSVFDGSLERLYTENDITNPLNIYAKTKLNGEQYVLEKKGLVIRTNIYGINKQNKMSFGEWIVISLMQGKTLNMFTDIKFSPILVNDLAYVIDLALENRLKGLYNVCATGAISKYDFGIKVKEKFEIETGRICKALSDDMHFEAFRPKNMGMSNEKISKRLDITLPTPEESIAKFKNIFYVERRGQR